MFQRISISKPNRFNSLARRLLVNLRMSYPACFQVKGHKDTSGCVERIGRAQCWMLRLGWLPSATISSGTTSKSSSCEPCQCLKCRPSVCLCTKTMRSCEGEVASSRRIATVFFTAPSGSSRHASAVVGVVMRVSFVSAVDVLGKATNSMRCLSGSTVYMPQS